MKQQEEFKDKLNNLLHSILEEFKNYFLFLMSRVIYSFCNVSLDYWQMG